MVKIAIDCMGGDHGLKVTIPACMEYLERDSDVSLILVGIESQIRDALQGHPEALVKRTTIHHASEVVGMDEPPAQALRGKKDSSIRVAASLVKEGSADAVVSAGNTGALMAISRYILKTLDGIDRPAIASALPNQKGGATLMLDLGANVDCAAEHLLQFAYMGSALVAATENIAKPTVGLLNIGEELIKGNETVKAAAELLRASTLNFFGNVEGNDIFKGTTDVVVCDGFVGNVALKTSEGLAQMLGGAIKEEFQRNLLTKSMAVLSLPVLLQFKKRVDHRRYNGAALLGLNGIVVKSHGGADAYGFSFAIKRARDAARARLIDQIRDSLAAHKQAADEKAAALAQTEAANEAASASAKHSADNATDSAAQASASISDGSNTPPAA